MIDTRSNDSRRTGATRGSWSGDSGPRRTGAGTTSPGQTSPGGIVSPRGGKQQGAAPAGVGSPKGGSTRTLDLAKPSTGMRGTVSPRDQSARQQRFIDTSPRTSLTGRGTHSGAGTPQSPRDRMPALQPRTQAAAPGGAAVNRSPRSASLQPQGSPGALPGGNARGTGTGRLQQSPRGTSFNSGARGAGTSGFQRQTRSGPAQPSNRSQWNSSHARSQVRGSQTPPQQTRMGMGSNRPRHQSVPQGGQQRGRSPSDSRRMMR